MSLDTPYPAPRIELESTPALRLEPEPTLPATLPREPPSTLALTFGGLAILALTATGLTAIHLIAAAFALSRLLGWTTLAATTLGLALIATGIARELRGLWGIRRVDHLRAALASTNPTQARAAAADWLTLLGQDPASLAPNHTAATLRALLQSGPAATLRRQTDALSTTASLQILAAIAAVPSPMLDGLVVAWRGIRLVRQVAELHGLRPGLLATISLLRRTLLSAALVTATDIATNTAAHALLSNKLLSHIAGDTAAALVAARRMRLLARAAAVACSPL